MVGDRPLRRFITNAGMYGVSLVLTRIGWFLLLPVYWKHLSPADFGIIGIAYLVQLLLGPILSLGLYDALLRFYLEWKPEERRRQVAGMWLLATGWSTLAVAALLLAGPRFLADVFVQVPFHPYLEMAIATAFLTNAGVFPLAIMRIREDLLRYSLVTIGVFASQAALVLYFVVWSGYGVTGYLGAMLLSALAWAIYYVWAMRSEVQFPVRWAHMGEPVRYSLPIIPVAVLEGAGNVLDRYFLDKHVGISQIGLYNLGQNFGSAFGSFNQILKNSWVPFLYKVVAETSDGPRVLGRYSVYYLALLALPALAVSLLAKEYIEWFGGTRYEGVYQFVPWFVLIYFVLSVGSAMGRGLDLAKKTQYWILVPVVGIASSIAALALLVPRFGIWGAVASVLLAAVLRTAVQLWLAQRFYPRPLYGASLLGVAAFSSLTFGIGYQIDTGNTGADVVLKLALLAFGGSAVLWAGFGTHTCRRAARFLVSRATGRA